VCPGLGAATQHRDHRRQVGRKGDGELAAGAVGRVHEAEMDGVERHARHCDGVLLGVAVDRIAEHGMAEIREVDAHLVRPPGAELGLDERHRAEALQRLDRGPRRAPPRAGRQRCASRTGAGTADAAIDMDLRVEVAGHQRLVPPGHGVRPELPLQMLGSRMVARQHHHARGVAVEPVDHVNTAGSAAALAQLHHEPGQDGVLLTLDRRVDEHAGGLVDDDEVVVEVDDRDPRTLRLWPAAGQVRLMGDDGVGTQTMAGIGDDLAVDDRVADQHLALRTGERRAQDLLQTPGEAGLRRPLVHGGTITPLLRRKRC
jgi:hypothetical protein